MSVDQENVTKILSVLSHPLRRQILRYISEKQECSFTDLMNALNVDTGKLSFHLRSLEAFLEQTPTNKYRLSKVGENAIVLIKDLEAWSVEAEIAKKTTTLPLARFKDRAIAFLADFALAFALFMAVPNVPSSLTAGVGAFLNINIALFLLLLWMYLTLLEGFAGQTLGKRLMGLKVVTTSEKRLFYDHAAVRNFGIAFLLPVDLLIGLRLKDRRYIRYFDKFAGTTVIDLRGRTRASEEKKATDNALETSSQTNTSQQDLPNDQLPRALIRKPAKYDTKMIRAHRQDADCLLFFYSLGYGSERQRLVWFGFQLADFLGQFVLGFRHFGLHFSFFRSQRFPNRVGQLNSKCTLHKKMICMVT